MYIYSKSDLEARHVELAMKIQQVGIVLLLITLSFTTSSETYSLFEAAKPGCETRCGDIIVPYPFGITNNCSFGPGFDIYCNTSSTPPIALIQNTNYTSIKQISDSTLLVSSMVATRCYSSKGIGKNSLGMSPDLTNSPYTFSRANKFIAIGCNDYAWITNSEATPGNVSTGCVVFCTNSGGGGSECSGNGCCQSSISGDITQYSTQLSTLLDEDDAGYSRPSNRCTYAFLAEENSFKFNGSTDLNDSFVREKIEANVSVVLEWAIGNYLSCEEADHGFGFACQSNSECVISSTRGTRGGYRCICKKGYQGNPYLSPGCQDINECEDPRSIPCYGACINTPGSYNCTCPRGYSGDATIVNGCQQTNDSKFSVTTFSIAMVFGMLAVISGISWIFFFLRRRKLTKLREKFFEQNGGMLLKQKMGSHETMTLFTTPQLRKATNHYSQENIIGRGAYGVVYKGVLSDERVVAIKKSKIMDASQAQQFINELLILTQIIHRHVVKLIGCCLEEEVPVLVYEYIPNNTLSYHIHSRMGGMSWLSWDNRLRVAVEAANAIAYLHSETVMPIIHRDVKSSNILLDDNYTTKISDFGASRLVPLDHEQVTTLIQGTLGYLDPEYFSTSQLTDKSDVYSFGVVLAELITGKKPIGSDRIDAEKNLATYFVNLVKQKRLYEIVEPRVLREGTLEQIELVGDLIKRCLRSEGRDRPTMREVVVELDNLRKFTTHPWIHQQASEETRSLVLEVEQSDLYEVPLVSYGTNI